MRIPPFMLTTTLKVRDYQGEGAYGSTYAPERDVKGYLEFDRRAVIGSQGSDVTIEAVFHTDPENDIPTESVVLVDGRELRAVKVGKRNDLAGPQRLEVLLG